MPEEPDAQGLFMSNVRHSSEAGMMGGPHVLPVVASDFVSLNSPKALGENDLQRGQDATHQHTTGTVTLGCCYCSNVSRVLRVASTPPAILNFRESRPGTA